MTNQTLEMLTDKQAAQVLGVHARTVARLRSSGELPYVMILSLPRIRRSTLAQFLEDNERRAVAS